MRTCSKYLHIACLALAGQLFSQDDFANEENTLTSKNNPALTTMQNDYVSYITAEDGMQKPKEPGGPSTTETNIILSADFIYWTPRQDGLEFAFTSGTPKDPFKGTVRKPNFKWDPGFKADLGIGFGSDNWEIIAQYTWLHSSTMKKSIDNVKHPFNSMWAVNNVLRADYETGKARWLLRFNVIDLECSRPFTVNRNLNLSPHFGLKGTWQDQSYRLRFTYLNLSGQQATDRMHITQDQWGIGIRGGLNTFLQFNRGRGLFGNLSLAGLWTNFKSKRRDSVTEKNITTTHANFKNDFRSIKLVLEWQLGFKADYWWSNDAYHILFLAAWEEQIWIANNQYLNLAEDNPYIARGGDLFLHGLTAKLRFDF
jgi:hypothetical protein